MYIDIFYQIYFRVIYVVYVQISRYIVIIVGIIGIIDYDWVEIN